MRYNVGADMKLRRLEWETEERLEAKHKSLRAKKEQLKRLDTKVQTALLVSSKIYMYY